MEKNVKTNKTKAIEEIELQPSWSKLKSFHGKAMVGTKENGDKYLKSFGFLVCEIIDGKIKIHNEIDKWDSKTTIRHINNFLYENQFETGNTKELTELYITKTKKSAQAEEKAEPKNETKSTEIEKTKNKKNENSNNDKEQNEKSKIKKIQNSKKEEKVKVGA